MSTSLKIVERLLQTVDDKKESEQAKKNNEKSFVPGMAGVIVGESEICPVGKPGMGIMYRGYSISDLSANCCFEEAAYVLTRNKLPNAQELKEYLTKLNKYYELSPEMIKILQITPKNAHPIDVMKIVCSFLGTQHPEIANYSDKRNVYNINQTLDACDRLLAAFPSAICFHYNYHYKKVPIETRGVGNEGIAEHILRLLHGSAKYKELKGYKTMINAMNVSLVCYAEHGLAASTFSSRVTASTLSDCYSAVCAAICSIKGALHGGANEMAMRLIAGFDGDLKKAENGINTMLKEKKLIMGFGHRIYKKHGDPRAPILKVEAKKLAKESEFGSEMYMNVSDLIESMVMEKKGIHPNMDFPAAMLYSQCGIPVDLYTPIFVCARTAGWFAHIIEQRKGNRLIRPSCLYKGSKLKKFVPINQRK